MARLQSRLLFHALPRRQGEQSKIRRFIIELIVLCTVRCNMSVAVHPERDELFFFGGDYFNGSKATVYDDLFQYKIKTNEWFQFHAPADHARPLPRSSHQVLPRHSCLLHIL